MGSGGKHRWKISFHRSLSTARKQPPKEFLCPISGSLMAEPVIVSSGHTFERSCVQAAISLSFTTTLSDRSTPDFSTVIPNLALKSAILNWSRPYFPKPLDFASAQTLVRQLKASQKSKSLDSHTDIELLVSNNNPAKKLGELTRHFSSSSEESVAPTGATRLTTLLPLTLTTRPSCYSSSSSSDVETLNPSSVEEDEFVAKFRSSQVFEQEDAVISLRKITRTTESSRAPLCTHRLLTALRSLIASRYASIQVNSVAALVNLSLEKTNKVKIVRSGIVPPLIDVLRGGFPEAQDHAAGALFSLALDDHNKTAIGVLGALPPLLHALRSDSERTRHDSALALYHLSLVQSNRSKLVKLGSVQVFLGMVNSGHLTGRIMLVLCNLAASVEGRGAMLDGGAVECFVGMLSRGGFDSESARESCVAVLYGLSHGGLRFKGLAKDAGVEEALRKVEEVGTERLKEKVRRILEVLLGKEEEEEVDWEELLNSGEVTRSRSRYILGDRGTSGSNSTGL